MVDCQEECVKHLPMTRTRASCGVRDAGLATGQFPTAPDSIVGEPGVPTQPTVRHQLMVRTRSQPCDLIMHQDSIGAGASVPTDRAGERESAGRLSVAVNRSPRLDGLSGEPTP